MTSLPHLSVPIILGSSSRFRQQILRSMGLTFTVISPDIDERSIRHSDPETLSIALAQAKANAVALLVKDPAIIITADQVVVVGNELREKPATTDEARRFLISYRTFPAETVSAVSVYNTTTGKSAAGIDRVKVHLELLSDDIIEEIINEGTIFHCAGGFAVEHPLMEPLVKRIEGERESVMGMPVGLTIQLLREVI